MRPSQIEAWALSIIERVEQGQNIEDVRVELKREWPEDKNRAARQLAGHANAARGEPILWLIGVDEGAHKVVGAPFEEFANWYPAIEKEFEAIALRCVPLNIPHRDGTVVALYLETDRAPFVVRNAAYGAEAGERVAFEVPWRDGNRTRTARRADLLKMLTPAAKLPDVELLSAALWARKLKINDESPHLRWELNIRLFISPGRNAPAVIPVHRCECSILPSEASGYELPLVELGFGSDTPGNIVTKQAITVNMPGVVVIAGVYRQDSYSLPLKGETVRVLGKGRPIGTDMSIDWSCELRREPDDASYVGMWQRGLRG